MLTSRAMRVIISWSVVIWCISAKMLKHSANVLSPGHTKENRLSLVDPPAAARGVGNYRPRCKYCCVSGVYIGAAAMRLVLVAECSQNIVEPEGRPLDMSRSCDSSAPLACASSLRHMDVAAHPVRDRQSFRSARPVSLPCKASLCR